MSRDQIVTKKNKAMKNYRVPGDDEGVDPNPKPPPKK